MAHGVQTLKILLLTLGILAGLGFRDSARAEPALEICAKVGDA